MQISKKTNNNPSKKPMLLALLTILLITSIGTTYYFLTQGKNHDDSKKPEQVSITEKEKSNNSDQANTQTKEKPATNTDNPNVDVSKTTDQIPPAANVSINISQLDHKDRTVVYAADITGSDGGTCAATFTNKIGKPVVKTTVANAGKCGPVTTSELEFDALGEWTLNLRYYKDNTQASATKNVTIN